MLDSTALRDELSSFRRWAQTRSKNCGYRTKKSNFAILVRPSILSFVPQMRKRRRRRAAWNSRISSAEIGIAAGYEPRLLTEFMLTPGESDDHNDQSCRTYSPEESPSLTYEHKGARNRFRRACLGIACETPGRRQGVPRSQAGPGANSASIQLPRGQACTRKARRTDPQECVGDRAIGFPEPNRLSRGEGWPRSFCLLVCFH